MTDLLQAMFPYGNRSFYAVRRRVDEVFNKHPEMKERDLLEVMVHLEGSWTLEDAVRICLEKKMQ